MVKLYFDKSSVLQQEGLEPRLSALVKSGMPRLQKQQDFQSLYDIEIKGVTVYYAKHWHYDGAPEKGTSNAL